MNDAMSTMTHMKVIYYLSSYCSALCEGHDTPWLCMAGSCCAYMAGSCSAYMAGSYSLYKVS